MHGQMKNRIIDNTFCVHMFYLYLGGKQCGVCQYVCVKNIFVILIIFVCFLFKINALEYDTKCNSTYSNMYKVRNYIREVRAKKKYFKIEKILI